MSNYKAGLPLWTVASKYFNLVACTASEIAAHGNPTSFFSDYCPSVEEIDEQTKWSDTDLSVPMLFDFYHGLEVMLKGFLVAKDQKAKGHNLSKLLNEVIKYHPNEAVFKLMANYIDQSNLVSPLKDFFQDNNTNPDEFYEVFKYPETMKGRCISHAKLKYGGHSRVVFYSQLAEDAKKISQMSARLAHSFNP